MWEAICLSIVASAGNNVGKVLQKKASLILPPFSFNFKVLRAYASNRAWIFGFLMDIFGGVLMLLALSQAPVTVIQPVSGCGLAILSIFSHFYLKEIMNVIDWMGILLAGMGTIGVGAGGEEQEALSISLSRLPLLALIIAFLFVDMKEENRTWCNMKWLRKLCFGLESGLFFGLASVASKTGFVFLEQGFSDLLILTCISMSISCSASGFFYQAHGLKHGRAIVVSTCGAVASIITCVFAGIFALGEQLPSAPVARLHLFLGWFFIIFGVILLVTSSRLLRCLPMPWRRFVRMGMEQEQNSGTKLPGSIRTRDKNPSTVIHTSTLHHLISSPSPWTAKE